MIFFKSVLKNGKYDIKIFDYQKIEDREIVVSDYVIIFSKKDILSKKPIGVIYGCFDYKLDEKNKEIIFDSDRIVPIIYNNKTVFPITGLSEKTKKDICKNIISYFTEYFDEETVNILKKEYKELKDEKEEKVNTNKTEDIVEKKETFVENIKNKYPVPSIEETGFYIDYDTWYLLIRNVLKKENVLITGPTGTGKTEFIYYLSNMLNKPLHIQDMGTIIDAQSSLLGVHRLNKEGHSVFEYAPFTKYIQENCIILLDELNRATLSVNNMLFPCLDKRRYLPVDISTESAVRNIPVNEEVSFIATANLGSEYTGTHHIDRALLDRFFPVEMNYLPIEIEIDVLQKRTKIDKKNATAIVTVANKIRELFKQQELSNTVSTRHTIMAGKLNYDGFSVHDSINYVFLPLFDNSQGINERDMIKSIITAF